tara:strand:+ start:369 stop:1988 length:1620 start_codon:yes stop_codon:yes gene_type:complete
MNRDIVYISDFFLEHILGGGELNDDELLKILNEKNHNIVKIRSNIVTIDMLQQKQDSFFIISNFINLNDECKQYLSDNLDYIIYEHDHKYVSNRNPAFFRNFEVPNKEIVNYFFYKNARSVFCQSTFHKNIAFKNLKLKNIYNVSGNLWSLDTLEVIRVLAKNKKTKLCSIMNSGIEHKNTRGAIRYASENNIKYVLIQSQSYHEFLSKLSKNDTFLFLPKTPETLSRVLVEARMLGCKVLTNNLVGASIEPWFEKKDEELIEYMISKRDEIYVKIKELSEVRRNSKNKPLVSIITTFHKGEKFLNHFMNNVTSQTYFDKCELVIVDAASPGNEKEIIQPYIDKYKNIIYKRIDEKLKPTPCLNEAIKLSSGKCLTLALIDDVKRLDCIEKLFNHLEKNDCSLVYGDVVQVEEENQNFEQHRDSNDVFEHSKYEFSHENMIKCLPGPMPLWYKNVHNQCGFFDDKDCNYADDWEMWLRMVSRGHKFKKLNEKIGLYLTGGRSQQEDIEQRKEESKLFFKYSNVFGNNYQKYYPYFKQFI